MNFFSNGLTRRRRSAQLMQRAQPGQRAEKVVCGLLFFFVLSFLTVSCEEPDFRNTQFIPVGEWSFGLTGYNITNTNLEYYSNYTNFEESLKGTIEAAVDFSHDSGVLIIKITSVSGMDGLSANKYTGVYYSSYTKSHMLIANPYPYIQKDKYNEAEATFNVDNVGTHVTFWGSGYSK